jgi:chromosome segregation ATPase
MTGKNIDFLFEDPEIQGQRFALVTIVGPLMPQKCDTWGIKLRGVADTIEKARSMSQKLMKIDNNYDIYTVEVGKFFPLAVEPNAVGSIEYQNSSLNQLMKSYLENKELANEHWHERKNEMIQQAIKEGREQESKTEHPIALMQRIKNYEEKVKELKMSLASAEEDLQKAKEKFAGYTEEERAIANNELENAIASNLSDATKDNIEEVRKQFMSELSVSPEGCKVESLINELKKHESELLDAKDVALIPEIEDKISNLKEKLANQSLVNAYINSNYKDSELASSLL